MGSYGAYIPDHIIPHRSKGERRQLSIYFMNEIYCLGKRLPSDYDKDYHAQYYSERDPIKSIVQSPCYERKCAESNPRCLMICMQISSDLADLEYNNDDSIYFK